MFDLQGFFSPLSKIGISYKVKKLPYPSEYLFGFEYDSFHIKRRYARLFYFA